LNDIIRKLKILLYLISNPQVSRYQLPIHYETWKDSKKKYPLHDYTNEIVQLEKILLSLFPFSNFSIDDLNKNTVSLRQHALNFFKQLENKKYPSKEKPYGTSSALEINSALFLYALCKLTKPEKVVETGVAYGLSSSYILQALYENKKGTLYSIDFTYSPWHTKKMIGSLTADHLRFRRKFVYGPSSVVLEKLLNSIGHIDIFFRDSLHTYKSMMYEFETAWPFIKKSGFLISDDVLHNNAFYEFHSKLNLKPFLLSQKGKAISSELECSTKDYLGIIQKK